MAARLIRDGYLPDHANQALRLLPEWTDRWWSFDPATDVMALGDRGRR